jgi:hypothetical protein
VHAVKQQTIKRATNNSILFINFQTANLFFYNSKTAA